MYYFYFNSIYRYNKLWWWLLLLLSSLLLVLLIWCVFVWKTTNWNFAIERIAFFSFKFLLFFILRDYFHFILFFFCLSRNTFSIKLTRQVTARVRQWKKKLFFSYCYYCCCFFNPFCTREIKNKKKKIFVYANRKKNRIKTGRKNDLDFWRQKI